MIKILLVDDQSEEREGISYLIHKYQFPLEILEASGGKEAICQLQKNEIDILFTDIKMPIMSGLELARIAKEMHPDIMIIIFSAYADFGYAKQAIEMSAVSYLIKPIEVEEFCTLMSEVIDAVYEQKESRKRMQAASEKSRKNLMYRVLTGVKVSLDIEMELQTIFFHEGRPQLFLINIEFLNNYFESEEEKFQKLCKMYLGKTTEYIALYPNEAYLIVSEVELLKGEALENQLEKLIRDVVRFSGDEAIFLVSRAVEGVEELEGEIREIQAVKPDLFGYDNRIIRVSQYYNDSEHYASDVEMVRKRMLAAIELGDADFIRRESEHLEKTIRAQERISRLYLSNVLYSAIKAICDKCPKMEAEQMLVAAEALFSAKNTKNMLKTYDDIMEQLLVSMGDDASNEPKIIQQIKNIVETEYMRDIGLNDVAQRVNLTPAYVSYIFKKEIGQTLVKYMTDIRMKKAELLLSNQSLKINQIGRMVGYDNQSYFNKLFKNYYGVTPKQYRDKL
jgi:two-component system response regulator YesN